MLPCALDHSPQHVKVDPELAESLAGERARGAGKREQEISGIGISTKLAANLCCQSIQDRLHSI